MTTPITRTNGVAGQFSLTAMDGTDAITFVGSIYGGPITMVTPGFPSGVTVSSPERFGQNGLTPEWVRAFVGTLAVMAERN